MKSTCKTKERGQLVQIECKWCNKLNRDNLKHKFYMTYNFWEEAPLPSIIIYSMTFHKGYIQMTLFFRTPKWESQNWDFYCFEFWTLISSSNQVFLEHARAISYIPQKIFPTVYYTFQSKII
jgi:hypothetical protein